MRASKYFFCTLKEMPHNIETISHQLMLRSGMIRKVTSGVYTWLPTGLRVIKKIENIIREELNKIGAIEICLPILQPIHLWKTSDRWNTYGKELLTMTDRRSNIYILGPTHEEIITYLIKNEIHSYKQLPIILYQIHTKFRDEIRPRFGTIRSKEFIMKDAYSFHIDTSSLKKTYEIMYSTYQHIFKRMKLNVKDIEANNGEMGGEISHEFYSYTNNQIKQFTNLNSNNNNIKKPIVLSSELTSKLNQSNTTSKNNMFNLIHKPNIKIQNYVKTVLVKANKNHQNKIIGLLILDHQMIDKKKLEKIDIVHKPIVSATREEIYKLTKSNIEYVGPIGLNITVIADISLKNLKNFMIGANINGKCFENINWGKELPLPILYDITKIITKKDSHKYTLKPMNNIEIGHIFQLEDKYSKKLNATIINKNNKKNFLRMGCYGIGITRIISAIIEQNYDQQGIIWNNALSPFQSVIIPINRNKSIAVKNASEDLYVKLKKQGIETLLDDRDLSPGIMFSEMELIGIPHFIIISERYIHKNCVEYKSRSEYKKKLINIEQIIYFITEQINK
ncbi:proline--tRNA ligase [Buchnera aphidicola]|uniref:proline--tRNA ligase n=1 Tax=Buchnera aphidicola TaxID=9 RepID=UPI0031B83F05